MTKSKVGEIIKRYPYVIQALREGKDAAVFYVGNRRQKIVITEEIKSVFEIFNDIAKRERDKDVLCMIEGIQSGRSDVAIMHDVHWQRNAYYDRKRRLIDKIFECCIYRRLVEYEEIMGREIA